MLSLSSSFSVVSDLMKMNYSARDCARDPSYCAAFEKIFFNANSPHTARIIYEVCTCLHTLMMYQIVHQRFESLKGCF